VRWSTSAGEITPAESRTDVRGFARAEWRLGEVVGEQEATASTDAVPPLHFLAFAEIESGIPAIPLHALTLETFDGSGQVVHPDVAMVPDGWDIGPLRLAITPYPWGNARFENPSLFAGRDGAAWTVPSGVTNPVVSPTTGYLSDPDLLFVPESGELWLYYRQVTSGNEVWVIRSGDGVRWSAPRMVTRASNHRLVSPAVVHLAPNDWRMWSVDAGASGCDAAATSVELRRSQDGLTWTAPVQVAIPTHGLFPWHLDVQWIPERHEHWMMFNAKEPGSCTTGELQLATSADGVRWVTYPSPVLRRGAIPEMADIVYRATFAWDAANDAVTIWHSGASFDAGSYAWHAAIERRSRADLFARVMEQSVRSAAAAGLAARRGPPLNNRTAP
jgi:hypothetical protein